MNFLYTIYDYNFSLYVLTSKVSITTKVPSIVNSKHKLGKMMSAN